MVALARKMLIPTTRETDDFVNPCRTFPAAAILSALFLASARPVVAGSTDPMLVIGEAHAGGGSPVRVVDLLGSWGFDDALQLDYPLCVVVSQGETFVRYPFGESPVTGSFAGIANGLAPSEIGALEAAGSPATGASISRLAIHEMTLAVPPVFQAGDLSIVLYVSLPGEGTFRSNTVVTSGGGS